MLITPCILVIRINEPVRSADFIRTQAEEGLQAVLMAVPLEPHPACHAALESTQIA